jgi:acetyltransferase-like isoleucine patch superfamily enzyme
LKRLLRFFIPTFILNSIHKKRVDDQLFSNYSGWQTKKMREWENKGFKVNPEYYNEQNLIEEFTKSAKFSIVQKEVLIIESVINDSTLIGSKCSLNNSVFGNYNKIGEGSYIHNVEYGDFSYNSIRCVILNTKIGKFCSIAQNVSTGLGKHPLNNFVSLHPAFYSTNKQCGISFSDQEYFKELATVEIGNDVWIGVNAVILDGVKIGNGAVIAANSVVTKDVIPYTIVGGTPAKLIKYRFSQDDIEFLETFKWWDKDLEWLENNFKSLHDIEILKKMNSELKNN